MKKTLIATATITATALIVLVAFGLQADEHERRGHEGHDEDHERAGVPIRAPEYARYAAECGDCHMAYPPALLPAASWTAVMAGLEDHFGDNAELDPATAKEIGAFLSKHAADSSSGEYAERTRRATRDRTPPLRISETDYFRGKHHEIPRSMVAGNPDVVSYARCEACHGRADQGIFEEDEVHIPGYGPWDD